jgi:hypothetical protein
MPSEISLRKVDPKLRRWAMDDFVRRLTLLKVEAFSLGLYKTGQLLEVPIEKVGYEMAELIQIKEVSSRR